MEEDNLLLWAISVIEGIHHMADKGYIGYVVMGQDREKLDKLKQFANEQSSKP